MIHAIRNDFNATFLPKFPRAEVKFLAFLSFLGIDIKPSRSFTDWMKLFRRREGEREGEYRTEIHPQRIKECDDSGVMSSPYPRSETLHEAYGYLVTKPRKHSLAAGR